MGRIDELESTVGNLQRCLQEVAAGGQLRDECRGAAQNLKDREIIEFPGDTNRANALARATPPSQHRDNDQDPDS